MLIELSGEVVTLESEFNVLSMYNFGHYRSVHSHVSHKSMVTPEQTTVKLYCVAAHKSDRRLRRGLGSRFFVHRHTLQNHIDLSRRGLLELAIHSNRGIPVLGRI